MHPHPKFVGVALQHLVTGADSGGQLSCHLVRVDPDCALDPHTHATQWELHQVMQGDGLCTIGERQVDYHPGCMAIIPMGCDHSVRAGENGLVLLATFSLPLIG